MKEGIEGGDTGRERGRRDNQRSEKVREGEVPIQVFQQYTNSLFFSFVTALDGVTNYIPVAGAKAIEGGGGEVVVFRAEQVRPRCIVHYTIVVSYINIVIYLFILFLLLFFFLRIIIHFLRVWLLNFDEV